MELWTFTQGIYVFDIKCTEFMYGCRRKILYFIMVKNEVWAFWNLLAYGELVIVVIKYKRGSVYLRHLNFFSSISKLKKGKNCRIKKPSKLLYSFYCYRPSVIELNACILNWPSTQIVLFILRDCPCRLS